MFKIGSTYAGWAGARKQSYKIPIKIVHQLIESHFFNASIFNLLVISLQLHLSLPLEKELISHRRWSARIR